MRQDFFQCFRSTNRNLNKHTLTGVHSSPYFDVRHVYVILQLIFRLQLMIYWTILMSNICITTKGHVFNNKHNTYIGCLPRKTFIYAVCVLMTSLSMRHERAAAHQVDKAPTYHWGSFNAFSSVIARDACVAAYQNFLEQNSSIFLWRGLQQHPKDRMPVEQDLPDA